MYIITAKSYKHNQVVQETCLNFLSVPIMPISMFLPEICPSNLKPDAQRKLNEKLTHICIIEQESIAVPNTMSEANKLESCQTRDKR